MPTKAQKHIPFQGENTCVIVTVEAGFAAIKYWGPRLEFATADEIDTLLTRTPAVGTPSIETPISLCPTLGSGFSGTGGIELHRQGLAWDFNPQWHEVVQQSPEYLCLRLVDDISKVDITLALNFCPESDVLKVTHTVTNTGPAGLTINWCCAGTLPLPGDATELTGFHGGWAQEFQTQSTTLITGAHVRENLRGRTSHASFPGLLAHAKQTTETQGAAYGFHLGWSGNHRLVAERLNDGRAMVQMGERLLAGEMILGESESYETPALYASFSATGFSRLSQNFHQYVRKNLLSETLNKPRPIHYNTWEAIYFDHDAGKLKALASKAASVGAERFILDDGWFLGRRDDTAGLGDWYIDTAIYPEGLSPLIDHVVEQGMEFGLWVEPEMVNPDSDLYRAHPDWVLSSQTTGQIPSRNQLVLDLTNPEVTDYLFRRLDALLSENAISYLKWDMNRDIHHPGSLGKPVVHQQTKALYSLIEKLRAGHPAIEIESCSSGGARADFGILEHTDRIWTSDNNDALDRLQIQKGMSFFFPSEVMGSHIGPRECHITGRHLPMTLRAATALFGHMGMELDLTELTEAEETILASAIALHKKHRALIHSGKLVRMENQPHANAFGIVAKDKSEALFSYTQIASRMDISPEVFHFDGLSSGEKYQMKQVWPTGGDKAGRGPHLDSAVFSGEALMAAGMQLPAMRPETALIFYLTQE